MQDVRGKYDTQKSKAKKRGIVFKFTFKEWCQWWEIHLGPNWLEKRGCRRGQYVMARNGDCGDYEWGNVMAIRAEQNIAAYNTYRKPVSTAMSKHLPDEIVRLIYLDLANYSAISKKYGVTKHRIQCIKQKHYYRKITDVIDEMS